MSTLFDSVALAPRDPILGLNEQFNADARPNKVNLGVGVYYDDKGKLPLLKAVHQAELALVESGATHGYLPIDGIAKYNKGAQELLLGKNSPIVAEGRAVTVQAVGGTGALKVGADFLRHLLPQAKVYISDPSWENHRALFESAGFTVDTYPYYDAASHGLNFAGMLEKIRSLPARSIVVLHACWHNPTGVDLDAAQWKQVAEAVKAQNLVPFLDIAYQGFGAGLHEDAEVVRTFADMGLTMLVSSSFSKSFSLYGERAGALTLIASSKDEATRVLSQIKRVIRTNYSNPPTHGGMVVANILGDAALFATWEQDLKEMRDRIRLMREKLVGLLKAKGVKQNFDFIITQRGMFSYSGLSAAQVERLRTEHGVYAVASGRICMAAINSGNIEAVASAIAAVL